MAYTDFEKIHLLPEEQKFLDALEAKSLAFPDDLKPDIWYEYGFVRATEDNRDVVVTTDRYRRYLIYLKEERERRILTPIKVSVATTLLTLVLRSLLSSLLPRIPELLEAIHSFFSTRQ